MRQVWTDDDLERHWRLTEAETALLAPSECQLTEALPEQLASELPTVEPLEDPDVEPPDL